MLEAELLAHLDAQIASARRLLALVLEQGAAIRARDVEAVLAKLTEIQTEMGRRGALEQDRTGAAAARRRRARRRRHRGHARGLCALVTPGAAAAARERSAELRGLLAEIAREHGINRALMRQELAFLSHLTRLIGGEPEPAYQARRGRRRRAAAPALHRVLDLQA